MPKGTIDKNLHDIDLKIGKRLKAFRQLKGVTQTQLAEKCGITFQQVQKYEHGDNRISASRLCQIAEILQIDSMLFFQDVNTTAQNNLLSEQTVKMVVAYNKIKNKNLAQALLVAIMSAASNQ